jgi:hypothetical protein
VLVYKATWAVFGLDGYLPYRLEVMALHLLPGAGVRLRASADRAEVRVRLFADPASAVLVGAGEPASTVLVRPQNLEAPAEWRVVSTAPVRACPASG